MFGFHTRARKQIRVGLICRLNGRGLGTEIKLLREIFSEHFPAINFSVYSIKRTDQILKFDHCWESNFRFRKWLESLSCVISVEQFFPNIFSECRRLGIKTIWRPNQEWILPSLLLKDLQSVDVIMTPQKACANFLIEKFGLTNIVCNPWITNIRLGEEKKHSSPVSFLFNAGGRGVGDRRNCRLVLSAMEELLAERDDVYFVVKTQRPLDVSGLLKYKKKFRYIEKNISYKKNLELYRSVDFSIAPSKWEGLGFSLLESLYCGTPVLTVDAPPMNEWVQHQKTGYLVPVVYPDVDLPIPFGKDDQRDGLNWVKAALATKEDICIGVDWLVQNRASIYENFYNINKKTLEDRKIRFLDVFESILLVEK